MQTKFATTSTIAWASRRVWGLQWARSDPRMRLQRMCLRAIATAGNQLDAVGVCGGDCMEDLDADGICDDVDDCIGVVDACGICNGPGKIYECGCADIPEGDCDCNGNQLDALDVCGGTCAEDLDSDGICDDVDDCVGPVDADGICISCSRLHRRHGVQLRFRGEHRRRLVPGIRLRRRMRWHICD